MLCRSEVLCKCESKPVSIGFGDFLISSCECAAVCGKMPAHVDIWL